MFCSETKNATISNIDRLIPSAPLGCYTTLDFGRSTMEEPETSEVLIELGKRKIPQIYPKTEM
ncbi:hypothetical protein WN55_00009 [Dufourea novaeangliae]|nr:hypothetical protein WN55_00009 [Dufourea novaeangliae]